MQSELPSSMIGMLSHSRRASSGPIIALLSTAKRTLRRSGGGLRKLDAQMPFLRFGEEGTHHAYELFLSEPPFWGGRGAPLFWAYAAREFTMDALPMDPRLLMQKYLAIAYEFGIPYGVDEYVYVERFAAGGMSSGHVGGAFIEKSLQTLLYRLPLYGTEGRLSVHYHQH